MAPQNSTLIHENAELASELSRYSPILTIKDEVGSMHADDDDDDDYDDAGHRRKSISSSEDINILQVSKRGKEEEREREREQKK